MVAPWVDNINELIASNYRPVIALSCGFAVAGCCFIHATADLAIPFAAGLAGGAGVLRTIDKKTAADVTKSQMVSPKVETPTAEKTGG